MRSRASGRTISPRSPIAAAVERAGVLAGEIEDVYFGCANQAGEDNRNVARMAALLAGLPESVRRRDGQPALRVGARGRRLRLPRGRRGRRRPVRRRRRRVDEPRAAGDGEARHARFPRGNQIVVRHDARLALPEPADGGDVPARVDGRDGRERRRALAASRARIRTRSRSSRSGAGRRRARRAASTTSSSPVGDVVRDEHPRPDTSAEQLAQLKPAFRAGGTVTAGNASGINDGAAALVIASEEQARELGVEPLGAFVAERRRRRRPARDGHRPGARGAEAARRAPASTVADLDLVELNEAFASQSLAVIRELGLDPERVNVNGGAIAIGHPLGMSGARLVVTLLHELRRRDGRYGLATLCVGVGQGQAALFER